MQDPDFRFTFPRLIIDGNEIDNVQHANLLGVPISNDLSWNKQVENIVAKVGKRVYMLYQLLKRTGIGHHDLVTAYVSVIRPVVLEYGIEFQNVYQSINTMSSYFEPICCAPIQLFFQE